MRRYFLGVSDPVIITNSKRRPTWHVYVGSSRSAPDECWYHWFQCQETFEERIYGCESLSRRQAK